MTRASGRRRRFPWGLLVLLFIAVPLVEIYVIIQVGQAIGAWWTILLLIADSLLGSWLIKREGGRAWEALRVALASGRMPSRELADGALILVGGTLMLSPGFVLDVVGLVLILPLTRPVGRRLLTRIVGRRLLSAAVPTARRPGRGAGPVVRGEVVDDDPH
ncbi:MAG TPA: FxsA family protein [Marmoricola sp.]|nr:FxsA family protein [Marmoricola sp.]